MLLIEHRVNTREHLLRLPAGRGIEVDVRDYDGDLRCVHDPLQTGEKLADLLEVCGDRLVIFNVKCDGLEERIRDLATQHRIAQWFFLDCAAPTLVRLTRQGELRVAVRYSEFEPIEAALAFAGRAQWLWIDCFTRLPLDAERFHRLHAHFRICLVSPELQKHPRAWIGDFRKQIEGLPVDAVCSDFCEDWT